MNLMELIPRKPDYLIERLEPGAVPEPTDSLTEWSNSFPHAVLVWLTETASKKRSLSDVLTAFATREEGWIKHILEGIQLMGEADIADRAANGYRNALRIDARYPDKPTLSVFGTELWHAWNNPKNATHNKEHGRRFELFFESALYKIPELRHSQSMRAILPALYLVPYMHDAVQMLWEQKNLDTGDSVDTKQGHALGACIVLYATSFRYAIEARMSIEQAKQAAAMAIYMMIRHDVPERFKDVYDKADVDASKTKYVVDDASGNEENNELWEAWRSYKSTSRYVVAKGFIVSFKKERNGEGVESISLNFVMEYSGGISEMKND
jgi:hypothetical protein